VGEGNKDNQLIKEVNLWRKEGDGGHLYGEEFLGIYF